MEHGGLDGGNGDDDGEGAAPPTTQPVRGRMKLLLGKKAGKVGMRPGDPGSETAVCGVCGERGHVAGFIGPTYQDCVSVTMACYNCKRLGHTTAGCPHRIKPGQLTGSAVIHGDGLARALSGPWRRRGTLAFARSVVGGLVAPPHACLQAAYRAAPTAYGPRFRWRVETAVLRLHTRRISLVSFHPTFQDRVVAADKTGDLSVWNFHTKHDRSVWSNAHRWLINALAWVGPSAPNSVVTASADGTVRLLDLETRHSELLVDGNPRGWTGVESQWRMFYAVSVPAPGSGLPILAGDDAGRLWALDPRDPRRLVGCLQAHKRGNKVQCVEHNPACPQLVVTCGNDWLVKLWDVRALSFTHDPYLFTLTPHGSSASPSMKDDNDAAADNGAGAPPRGNDDEEGERGDGVTGGDGSVGLVSSSSSPGKGGRGGPGRKGVREHEPHACLAVLPHPRVVTATCFSPATGTKLLTTCIDNRLRVWDDLHAITAAHPSASSEGSSDSLPPPPPSAEIVHSHDFARYLTPFKAVWDPKDCRERTVVCGRYISEAFPFGDAQGDNLALHPVDVLDVGPPRRVFDEAKESGPSKAGVRILKQLVDPLLPTICPVVTVHPSQDIIACGSSRSLYLWKPFKLPVDPSRAGGYEGGLATLLGRQMGPADDSADEDESSSQGRARSSPPPAPDNAALSSCVGSTGKGKGGGSKKRASGAGGNVLTAADIASLAKVRRVVFLQGPQMGGSGAPAGPPGVGGGGSNDQDDIDGDEDDPAWAGGRGRKRGGTTKSMNGAAGKGRKK